MEQSKRKYLRRGEGTSRFGTITYPALPKKNPTMNTASFPDTCCQNEIGLNLCSCENEACALEPSLPQQKQDWERRINSENKSLMAFEALELFNRSNESFCGQQLVQNEGSLSFCTPPSYNSLSISGIQRMVATSDVTSQNIVLLSQLIKATTQNQFVVSNPVFSTPAVPGCFNAQTRQQGVLQQGIDLDASSKHEETPVLKDLNVKSSSANAQSSGEGKEAVSVSDRNSDDKSIPSSDALSSQDRCRQVVYSGPVSDVVEKMRELERLMEKLRRDSVQIEETNLLCESKLKELDEEKQQLATLKKFLDAEVLKLRHEKIMLEKKEASFQRLGKKEVEDSKFLKREILELRNEACENESRWSAQRSKYKLHTDRLTTELGLARSEVDKLKNRLQFLEKSNVRLEAENNQLKVRLRNKDKCVLPYCESDKENSPAANQTIPCRPQSEGALDLKESSSRNGGILKTKRKTGVRFNMNSDNQPQSAVEIGPKLVSDQSMQTSGSFCSPIDYGSQNATCLLPATNIASCACAASMPKPTSLPVVRGPVQTDDINSSCSVSVDGSVLPQPSVLGQKLERMIGSCLKEIVHANGTVEHINIKDGVRKLLYSSGDTKLIQPSGIVVHTFASTNTTQTLYPDGTRVVVFADGQQEKHLPDGSVEARFPNGHIRRILPSGESVIEYPSGDKIEVKLNGDEVCRFTDGSVEERTKQYAKRRFPDGSEKILYPDGSSETYFIDGRIRKKDASGNVVLSSV